MHTEDVNEPVTGARKIVPANIYFALCYMPGTILHALHMFLVFRFALFKLNPQVTFQVVLSSSLYE